MWSGGSNRNWLFESARYQRCRTDGRSGHIADFQPAHRQLVTPWRLHGEQVRETMERMAGVVDGQNAGDAAYRNMAPDFDEASLSEPRATWCSRGWATERIY